MVYLTLTNKEQIRQELTSNEISYYHLSSTQAYEEDEGASVSVNAILKLYSHGEFVEIIDISNDIWSKIESGQDEYEWIAGNHWSDPDTFPATEITISASGFFTTDSYDSEIISITARFSSIQLQ